MRQNMGKWWVPVLLLLGCSGKLNVGQMPSSGGGNNDGNGGAGSFPTGREPGSLGKPCIAGSTEPEAKGTVAETNVTTLNHCLPGLACNGSDTCEMLPDCSEAAGPCVAYRSAAASGGQNGIAGGGNGAAGRGSTSLEVGVFGLTADDSNLYWAEYGSRDALGNYQHDGSIMAYSLGSGETRQVATKLEGPIDLAVTSAHLYAHVDGAALLGAPSQPRLLRLPIAGGKAEVVGEGSAKALTASGDAVYWNDERKWLSASGDSAPTTFLDATPGRIALADSSHLFFTTGMSPFEVLRASFARDPLETVTSPAYDALALHGDSVYALEPFNGGCVLDAAPKAGGAWSRVRPLGACNPQRLLIVGDRYFFASLHGDPPEVTLDIVTGLLTTDDPPTRIAQMQLPPSLDRIPLVGTANAVFWSDGVTIFKRSLGDLP